MAASIKAIDATSVHQITSAQVITDLQTAVKELLENSLDAGATSIDIKFKNFGSHSFEVLDNGSGVQPKDYAHIALKGYTSKLDSYDSLTSVTSFGFRGEALSSLCQLADVTVTTATDEEAPIGTVLNFDKRGQVLASTSKTARARGTTVHVANLFAGMPVRKRDFDKYNKKHFAAAQTLLQAYGLVSVGKRISLSNQPEGKPPQVFFKTDGKSLRDNYATLFGVKSANPLLDLELTLEVDAAKRVLKTAGLDELKTQVRVRGLISPPNANAGRTSGDRQFLFINGRPFEEKAINRAFNEVFKSYVPQHFPSIVADFELATDAYDVNVSPDKRSIFLHSEQNLIEALKVALDSFYSPSRATFTMDPTNMTRIGRLTASAAPALAMAIQRTPSIEVATSSRSALPIEEDVFEDEADSDRSSNGKGRILEGVEEANGDLRELSQAPTAGEERENALFRRASTALPSDDDDKDEEMPEICTAKAANQSVPTVQAKLSANGGAWALSSVSASAPVTKKVRREKQISSEQQATLDRMDKFLARASQAVRPSASRELSQASTSSVEEGLSEDIDIVDTPRRQDDPDDSRTSIELDEDTIPDSLKDNQAGDEIMILDSPDTIQVVDARRSTPVLQTSDITLDLSDMRSRLAAGRRKRKDAARPVSVPSSKDELEDAGIKIQDDEARKSLSRLVSKEDFAKMKVIGQFNLAFIIVRRREAIKGGNPQDETASVKYHDDLMIIDQHASDEKYNFERLQQVTKIDSQRLIKPRMMELPASDELLAIEHEIVLRFNGFEIEVDEDAPVGQRIKLVSMPISKSTRKTEFTVEDFEELLYLLRERTGPGMVRPTKTRRLFAMLACRSSIMVGKVLNSSQMTTVVKHMGTLDQPWNCPHGRNTMRWLSGIQEAVPDKRFTVSASRLRKFQQSC